MSETQINDKNLAKLREMYHRLTTDFTTYAKYCLVIKDKQGKEIPFVLNRAQRYLHNRIENQLARIGKVRILIVKGRQQGCSTYVEGRYYFKTSTKRGQSAYILSHEGSTTNKLFGMAKTFYDNTPLPMRPNVVENNARSFKFDNGSSYSVGTAGNKNTGRGGTVQLFHGSEVAFYENTDELQTGVLQSISDMEGTEIILESTTNGLGNYFHQACMSALKGEGEFELVFIPWFWQPEYTAVPPENFTPTEEELKLIESYQLTYGQLYWRRLKIISFGAGGEWKFKQEYPCSIHEAFVFSGTSMIEASKIHAARKRNNPDDMEQPMILGIDSSRRIDRFVIAPRRGRKIYKPMIINPKDYGEITTSAAARFILDAVELYKPDKGFIDVTKDWGVYDYLVNMGFGRLFTPVVFSEGALRKELYLNKRVEMLMEFRDWFDNFEVDIPDDDAVHSDIAAIPVPKQTAGGRWMIDSKDIIKQKYGLSTDIADAIALTFAFPVRYTKNIDIEKKSVSPKIRVKKMDTIYSSFRKIENRKEGSEWGQFQR